VTRVGFVSFPAHDGTTTAERVTKTLAGAADGQPGRTVMVLMAGAVLIAGVVLTAGADAAY